MRRDDLADQIAERVDVITVAAPGRPPRSLVGQREGHRVPVQHRAVGQSLANRGKARAMAQDLADRHGLLSARLEAGPVARDARVEIQRAALHEPMGGNRSERLSDREDCDQSVGPPRAGLRGVNVPAPDICHDAAIDPHAERRSDLAVLREVAPERIADRLEARVAMPVDHNVAFGERHSW